MAVRIVRQPNKLALIGAPTSAAAHQSGQERAPEALRAAGLLERLAAIGYEVADTGDLPAQFFAQDDEHPRARNAAAAVAVAEALKPRVEQAVKSGALPVVLGGDCTITLGSAAGLRRYYRTVGLVWCDRDTDLNVPATSPSGRLHGMAVAHVIGRGAPELVRFWGEPPLVRPTEIHLFGFDRLDPPERALLEQLPVQRMSAGEILGRGAAAAAEAMAGRVRRGQPFVLHLDVDVIASEDFTACEFPASGGLRLGDVRAALEVFARHPDCAVLEVAEYNPEKDPDGAGARLVVELIAAALAARYEALVAAPARAAAEAAPAAESALASEEAAEPQASAEPPPAEASVEAESVEEPAPAASVTPAETAAVAYAPHGSEAAGEEPAAGGESAPESAEEPAEPRPPSAT